MALLQTIGLENTEVWGAGTKYRHVVVYIDSGGYTHKEVGAIGGHTICRGAA